MHARACMRLFVLAPAPTQSEGEKIHARVRLYACTFASRVRLYACLFVLALALHAYLLTFL